MLEKLLEWAEKDFIETRKPISKVRVSLFLETVNLCKAMHLFEMDGIFPETKLFVNVKTAIDSQLPRESGIVPFIFFSDKSNCCSSTHFPILSGMGPVRLLVCK